MQPDALHRTELLPRIERGPTWTAEHLHACLARSAARMPDVDRKKFFESWERRHGRESAARLHQDARTEYRNMHGKTK